ncbi:tetratricopeptide (TPR) repeat protein [Desulfitispora alkaliphila]|uniref:tetratricopeptide repeat protein n=1 Tax=Desulfitispora alkaliphila TaxID=622674 RepID=UPI003D1BF43E
MDQKDVLDRIQKIKRTIEKYIKEEKYKEAMLGIAEYEKVIPKDKDILLYKGQITYKQGDIERAKELFLQGLKENPNVFMFSYFLGACFEKEEQYLDAYNSYRNAEFLIQDEKEKKLVQNSMNRLKLKLEKNKNRGMKINHKKDYYEYIVKANKEVVRIIYKLDELRLSKGFLEIIIENAKIDEGKVFEINCNDGVIARTLSDIGFNVLAVDNNTETRLKWIGIELNSKIRDTSIGTAKYLDMNFDLDKAKKLSDNFNMIILLPRKRSFFEEFSLEELKEYIDTLEEKSKEHFFFALPAKLEDHSEMHEKISKLKEYIDSKKTYKVIRDKRIEGYELLFLDNLKEEKNKTLIPTGLEVEKSKSSIFYVDIEKCCDLNGFHYVNDWQHFVEVIKEYEENPNIRYEDSVLKKYYESFTPRNLQEQYYFDDEIEESKKPISEGWGIYPWFNVKGKVKAQTNRVETRPGGSHHFGPNKDSFGKEEFDRIITTYKILKDSPYEPEIYVDGYMYGYILKNGKDYRFLFTEGQHRIAVFAYLGYKKVKCKLVDEKVQNGVVDIDDIKKWGMVKSGVFSRNLAKQLFNKFFERRGIKVAKKLDLI